MKVNVLYNNSNDVIEGYRNIDIKKGNSSFAGIDKGECDEIVLHDTIRYPIGDIKIFAQYVAIGGKLVTIFYELDEVIRAYQEERLSIKEFQDILYGTHESRIINTPTMEQVESVLKELNFKIVQKKINNITGCIVAERQNG